MPYYRVSVVRMMAQQAWVGVEASSPQEATRLALNQAEDNERDYDWDQQDAVGYYPGDRIEEISQPTLYRGS